MAMQDNILTRFTHTRQNIFVKIYVLLSVPATHFHYERLVGLGDIETCVGQCLVNVLYGCLDLKTIKKIIIFS